LRMFSSSGLVLLMCGCIFAIPTKIIDKTEETRQPLKEKVILFPTHKSSCYKRCLSYLPDLTNLLFDYGMFTRNKALSVWTLSLSLILSGYFIPFVFLVS
jgi:hypothetical protein